MIKRLTLVIALGVALLVAYFFLGAEAYFPPYPYINTTFAPGFTLEGFKQIQLGMSRAEVAERIGDEPYLITGGSLKQLSANELSVEQRKQLDDEFLGIYILDPQDNHRFKSGSDFPDAYCHVFSDDKHIWGAWIRINVCYDSEGPDAMVVGKNELIINN